MKVILDHINTFYSFFSQICIALGNFNLPWGGDLHDDDNNIPFFIIKKTTQERIVPIFVTVVDDVAVNERH